MPLRLTLPVGLFSEEPAPHWSYTVEGSAPICFSIAYHAVARASILGLPCALQRADLHLMAGLHLSAGALALWMSWDEGKR